LITLDGFFHAAGWVGGNKAVVHGLIERRREDALHHAYGVGVQTLLDLAGLEGAHVGGAQVSQLDAAEEGYQVIAAGSFVALEGAFADLVAGRVGEPILEVLANRHPPRVGE
jgi:hypothetical protein